MEYFHCLYCGNPKKINKSAANKFCNNSCLALYNYTNYIVRWKDGLETGQRGKFQVSAHIARYLRQKYNNMCCLCGWNKVNLTTRKCPLDIDHIDGNPYNNKEENLRLICPNCHALTSTYKALNKGNGRKGRNTPD